MDTSTHKWWRLCFLLYLVVVFFFGEVIVLINNDSASVSSSALLYDLTTMSDRSISKQHGSASPTPVRQNPKLRKRGKRDGVRVRTRKRGVKKPFLPVLVLGNARSLNNKTEELQACTRHLYEYRESSIMCFSETWLITTINDSHVNIDGFTIARSDRTTKSGKQTNGPITTTYTPRRLCAPQTSNFWLSVFAHTTSLEKSPML